MTTMAWNLVNPSEPILTSVSSISGSHVELQDGQNCILKVLHNLKSLREEGKFCDVTLVVNNRRFDAHRAVLAAWSPLLAAEMMGTSEGRVEVTVHWSRDDLVLQCLDLMYSGAIAVLPSDVVPLLQLGHSLRIEALVYRCEDLLVATVDSNNFIAKYFLALQYNLHRLQAKIVAFIETNIALILEKAELLNLSPCDFKAFITQGQIETMKPEVKFSLVLSWAGVEVKDREHFLLHLLSQLNMDPSVDLLMQISCTQNIFTTNEYCLFQLLHSLVTTKGHNLGPFLTIYPQLFSKYSHLLNDLVDPKVFSEPGGFLKEPLLIGIHVSEVASPRGVQCNVQDMGVNTDVCLTDSLQDPVSEVVNNVDTFEDGHSAEKRVSFENDEPLTGELVAEKVEPVITRGGTKHRRKSLPRKRSVENGDVEKKDTKKSMRKPRKNEKKEAKDVKVGDHNEKYVDEENGMSLNSMLGMPSTSQRSVSGNIDSDGNQLNDDLGEIVHNDGHGVYVGDTDSEVDLSERFGDKDRQNGNNVTSKHDSMANEEQDSGSTKIQTKSRLVLNLKNKRRSRGRPKGSKNNKKEFKIKKDPKPKMRLSTSRYTAQEAALRKMPKISCTEEGCDFTCRRADILEKHNERVHMCNATLKCHKCEFSTADMKALCLHMKTHYTKLPFQCEVLDCKMTFLRIGLFIRHLYTHLDIRPYKCDLCGKQFAVYNQLATHQKLHEGRQFECDVCLKRFTTKGAMQTHRNIHFSNKPYLCDTCGFSTKHQSHLISHKKIHTGDVLRCSMPNCNYTTPKQGHMTQHMNSHLNIRNHICQVCGKSFVVRGKLLRHERIHLKEKLFKCKQCDYQTSRTDRMKLHIESHGIRFPKKKFNVPNVEEAEEADMNVDQFYERIHPEVKDMSMSEGQNVSVASFTNVNDSSNVYITIGDMKPSDVISFAASSSMIVDSYNTARLGLDPLSAAAAAANIDDLHSATFAQNFDRIQATPFDQL